LDRDNHYRYNRDGDHWRESVDRILYLCATQANPIYIPNSDRRTLARLFRQFELKIGAEIGVGGGIYSEMICQEVPGVKLYCVDWWEPYAGYRDIKDPEHLETDYKNAQVRLRSYNTQIIKAYSGDAAKQFYDGSLDFVYIDANHDSPYIDEDIREWSKKVRPGGIVSGHDYMEGHRDVMRIVDDYTYTHKIDPWFAVGQRGEMGNPELIPSWFWVQP
jgi:predicted O-methyltransferase YrrM